MGRQLSFDVFNHQNALDKIRPVATKKCKLNDYDFISNKEIMYTRNPIFENFLGNRILLVGGGPSSLTLTKEQLEKYDSIWSMNHFFLNPLLFETEIDVAMISLEVDLRGEKLHKYAKTHNTIFGIEWHSTWLERIPYLISGDLCDKNRLFFMHTRFYSKLGYGVRMIILASELGVNQIDVIGLDGPVPLLEGNHAFQKGKKILPSGINPSNIKNVFKNQYDAFWTYVRKTYPKVKYNVLCMNRYHEKCR